MFVYTMSKKKAYKVLAITIACFIALAIGGTVVWKALQSKAEERKLPIYSVERSDNKIALTFDCAWGNSNINELLEIMEKENVISTFFITGEFATKYPEDVRKIANAGHEIANHSNVHPHLKGININDLIADTKEAERKIKASSGGEFSKLYRAPYGEYDDKSLTTLEGMGYQIIQWSADSIDWKENEPGKVSKNVIDKTKSGGILLFHTDKAVTTEALPGILVKLKQSGFSFTRVSDLVYDEGYTIDHTGKQIKAVESKDSATTPKVDTGNKTVDKAILKLATNLTETDIEKLQNRNNIDKELYLKLAALLSSSELSTINSLSEESYAFAWDALSAAASVNVDDVPIDGDVNTLRPEDINPNDVVTDNINTENNTAEDATTTTAEDNNDDIIPGQNNEVNNEQKNMKG